MIMILPVSFFMTKISFLLIEILCIPEIKGKNQQFSFLHFHLLRGKSFRIILYFYQAITKQGTMSKRIVCTAILVFTVISIIQAQDEKIKIKGNRFVVGIGFNIGYFNPEDVNQYIETWLDDKGYIETIGFTDMVLNLGGHINMGYRFTDYIELYGTAEYCAGMKYFSIAGGNNYFFHIRRISPGLVANVLIPLSYTGKNSFFVGAGIFFHMLKFEEYEETKAGFRGQIGVSLNNFNFNPQLFIAYDSAKATDKDQPQEFELDFSGFQLGINLNF